MAEVWSILHHMIYVFWSIPQKKHTFVCKHILCPGNKQYQKDCQNSSGLSVTLLGLTHCLIGRGQVRNLEPSHLVRIPVTVEWKSACLCPVKFCPPCACHMKSQGGSKLSSANFKKSITINLTHYYYVSSASLKYKVNSKKSEYI